MATHRGTLLFRRLLPLVALALLTGMLPLSFAAAQAPAPKQTVFVTASFKGVATPGATFDLVQSVIDFKPGAKSAVVATTVGHYLSVADGELTFEIDGKAETVAAGNGTAAAAGAKLAISNPSTETKARLFVSTLVAVGAVTGAHQPSATGITVVTTSRVTMSKAPATVDLTQAGYRYDIGYTTPNHVMNQPHLQTITEGQCAYTYLDGLKETYSPGAQVEMYVGRAGNMSTSGPVKCAFLMTWVATPGAPLTVAPPAAPAPPKTGTGLAQDGSASPVAITAAVLILLLLSSAAFAAKHASDARRHR